MALQSVVAILAKLSAAGMVMLGAAAHAAEIKVIGSPGTKEPYTLLVPDFEKASGHKVVTIWDGVNNVHKRIAGGEVADVVMVPVAQIDDLIRQGKLVPDSRVVVATSGVGVAIRAGAPKPEMTAEGIKQALLKAKSIAYSQGPSGVHIARLIEQWGIAEQVRAKIVPPRSGMPIGEVVARGEAEIGFQQLSELIHTPGVSIVGAIPAELQPGFSFSAALTAAAKEPEAAKALIGFLASPESATVVTRMGLAPIEKR
jgi:molybdate transport system substrate-binding protein